MAEQNIPETNAHISRTATEPTSGNKFGSNAASVAISSVKKVTSRLSDAILTLGRNRRFRSSLAIALVALSAFVDKQTKNDNLSNEERNAILQIGTLGYTMFSAEIKKGSLLDQVTPEKFNGIFAEGFKEMLEKVAKADPILSPIYYNPNVNAPKDPGRFNPYEPSPMDQFLSSKGKGR